MKKITIAIIILILLLATFFYIGSENKSKSNNNSITSSNQSSQKKDNTTVSLSSQTSSQIDNTSDNNTSDNNSSGDQSSSQTFDQANSANSTGTIPSAGQGHVVNNAQDALDVVKTAFASSIGNDVNDFEFDVYQDPRDPNSHNFDVQTIIKSAKMAGGSGTAGIYSVSPNGHFGLIVF